MSDHDHQGLLEESQANKESITSADHSSLMIDYTTPLLNIYRVSINEYYTGLLSACT